MSSFEEKKEPELDETDRKVEDLLIDINSILNTTHNLSIEDIVKNLLEDKICLSQVLNEIIEQNISPANLSDFSNLVGFDAKINFIKQVEKDADIEVIESIHTLLTKLGNKDLPKSIKELAEFFKDSSEFTKLTLVRVVSSVIFNSFVESQGKDSSLDLSLFDEYQDLDKPNLAKIIIDDLPEEKRNLRQQERGIEDCLSEEVAKIFNVDIL